MYYEIEIKNNKIYIRDGLQFVGPIDTSHARNLGQALIDSADIIDSFEHAKTIK